MNRILNALIAVGIKIRIELQIDHGNYSLLFILLEMDNLISPDYTRVETNHDKADKKVGFRKGVEVLF